MRFSVLACSLIRASAEAENGPDAVPQRAGPEALSGAASAQTGQSRAPVESAEVIVESHPLDPNKRSTLHGDRLPNSGLDALDLGPSQHAKGRLGLLCDPGGRGAVAGLQLTQ